MSQITSEQLAERLLQCELVTNAQLNDLFSDYGKRDIDVNEFQNQLLRRELLTNWQLERVLGGHTTGFFYGKYKVLYIVGAGTFARVYRATHRETGDLKAVKVLRSRYSGDMDTTEQFLQEARTVISLRHPNIVPIYEVGVERHRHFMVMEFIEGQNLRDYVSIHGKLNLLTALNIAKDIAAGLDYAFGKGVCHRDLKLSNVLLHSGGRALLVDFGLAGAGAFSKDSDAGGTPRSIDYAGLERASGVRRDDKRSDIFFWGSMLYHMVCGKPALAETRDRTQRLSVSRYREIRPVTEIAPELPHRVVSLIFHTMVLNPDERMQTPGEVLNETKATIAAITSGDVEAYNESRAQQEQVKAKEKPISREGESYTLMLIESHAGIQNALRDALKKVGYKVLIFTNPRRALMRFQDTGHDGRPPADCVLFGCGEIGAACLDAFNYFAEDEYSKDTPAILITDEKQAHFKTHAKLAQHRVSMEMPIKFRELRQILHKLIKIKASSESK